MMLKKNAFLFLVTLVLPQLSRALVDHTVWGSAIDGSFDHMEQVTSERSAMIAELARQIMYDRYMSEERIRSEGGSGLVGVKNYKTGAMNYHSFSFTSTSDFAALHDHPECPNLLGFGEAALAMNGVHFRSKHTDYEMLRPHSSSSEWHATEPIAPPPVPDTIDTTAPVEEQIAEMQEYFRAFRDQNITHRDYRNYFKPVMCYIEGKWLADTSKLEPINSYDLTQNLAMEYDDLIAQARLDTYLGLTKRWNSVVPNLPRTLLGLNSAGQPVYAQWHYRVLCYPFTMDELPQSHFRLVDDLAYRIPNEVAIEDLHLSRGARYIIDEASEPGYHDGATFLDKLIARIPGLDNVPDANPIYETEWLDRHTNSPEEGNPPLNRGYYNHIFHDTSSGLLGVNIKLRGFGDPNVYVAHTRQEQVSPVPLQFKTAPWDAQDYDNIRLSWLLPLEVVYLSPLLSWNPYNIPFYAGDVDKYPAKSVTENRDGSENKPYNGTNSEKFFRTPSAFFSEPSKSFSQTDSWTGVKYVLNSQGDSQLVAASGIRTIMPKINNDVGSVRLRYPILPLHKETDPVWKELNAYKAFMNQELKKIASTFLEAGNAV